MSQYPRTVKRFKSVVDSMENFCKVNPRTRVRYYFSKLQFVVIISDEDEKKVVIDQNKQLSVALCLAMDKWKYI